MSFEIFIDVFWSLHICTRACLCVDLYACIFVCLCISDGKCIHIHTYHIGSRARVRRPTCACVYVWWQCALHVATTQLRSIFVLFYILTKAAQIYDKPNHLGFLNTYFSNVSICMSVCELVLLDAISFVVSSCQMHSIATITKSVMWNLWPALSNTTTSSHLYSSHFLVIWIAAVYFYFSCTLYRVQGYFFSLKVKKLYLYQ